jgi:hypothetical protein
LVEDGDSIRWLSHAVPRTGRQTENPPQQRRLSDGYMAAALFRHKLQILIALYLYAVGYIIKPPGSLLERLSRLAGLEPLVMDWIGQAARDAVNGPVELV